MAGEAVVCEQVGPGLRTGPGGRALTGQPGACGRGQQESVRVAELICAAPAAGDVDRLRAIYVKRFLNVRRILLQDV